MPKENNGQDNTSGKSCVRCEYMALQEPTKTPDDGLVPVRILSWSPESVKKVQEDPDNYRVSVIPTTYSRGTLVIGSMTALNKYSQLQMFAKSFQGMVGPNYVETRDNQITIHNGKTNGNPKFAYTYAGGTGELLEFSVKTSNTQTITSVKQTSIDPDDKSVNTEVDQGIPTEEGSSCEYDMFVNNWSNRPQPRNQVDALYMAPKPRKSLRTQTVRNTQSPRPKPTVYNSEEEAKTILANSAVLTAQEVAQYNDAMKKKFNELINVKTPEEYLQLLLQSGKLEDLIIKRKVLIYVDPMKYSTLGPAFAGDKAHWKSGYRALESSKDVTIVLKPSGGGRFGGYSPGNNYGTPGDKVIIEKEVEIQIPGIRVMASPNFITTGQAPLSDMLVSLNNQSKSNARFVGNPSMESSQNMEIHNVSNKYSGIWYSKEVTHTMDGSGYFTEVVFNKKTQNILLNRIKATVNTQSIYKETQKILEESYRTGAWKYPTQIEAFVKKYREDSWRQTGLPEGMDNRQIWAEQNPDPTKPNEWTVYESRMDIETGTPITKEIQKVTL